MRRMSLLATVAALLAAGLAPAGEGVFRGEIDVTGIGLKIGSAPASVAPPGGEDTSLTFSGRASLSVDFGRALSGIFTVEGWGGREYDPVLDLITLTPLNGDIEVRTARVVTEAYVTVKVSESSLRVSAGLADVKQLFNRTRIASDPRTQFMNYSFTTSPAVEYPGGGRSPYALAKSPYALAAWASYQAVGVPVELSAGWADMDENDDESYYFAELRLKRSHVFSLGIFGWQAGGLPTFAGPTQKTTVGYGGYVDWLPRGDLAFFLRAAFSDPAVSKFESSWSMGVQIIGTPWNRPGDMVGLAYGANTPSGDFMPGGAAEAFMEFYYKILLVPADRLSGRPGLEITPSCQLIWNAGGIESNDVPLVLGLRIRTMLLF